MAPARIRRTTAGKREATRESRLLSPDPGGWRERVHFHPDFADPDQAVADLVERVCRAYGGAKALAGGLIPVSYPQIRRWASDGSIPGLGHVLTLVRLAGPDDPFRRGLIRYLKHLFDPPTVDPEEVARRVAERVSADPEEIEEAVREAIREQARREMEVRLLHGPGGRGESYG